MSHLRLSAQTPLRLLHRILAVGAVLLTLLLTLAAASPSLHEWLHGDAGVDANDSCAVVLFANGVTLASTAVALAALPLVWRVARAHVAPEVFVASPRFLRLPERGPPAV